METVVTAPPVDRAKLLILVRPFVRVHFLQCSEGKATAEILPLSFKEAIERGLRNNLGILLQSDSTLTARGERWNELSALLPHLNAAVSEAAEQIDLAAEDFALTFRGYPT